MTTLLITVAADLLKALLPTLLTFFWNQAHEPTTVEEAKADDIRRDRLLAAIRLRRSAGSDSPSHPAAPVS